MVIQSSINQSLASVAGFLGLNKLIKKKNQEGLEPLDAAVETAPETQVGQAKQKTENNIKLSEENLSTEQLLNATRRMAVKERRDFLKQAGHIQSQAKRDEQKLKYEENKK